MGIDPPEFCVRADGRIELYCEHGVGHPSPRLTKLYRGCRSAFPDKKPSPCSQYDGCVHWNNYDGIHGCCGCCLKLPIALMEYEDG